MDIPEIAARLQEAEDDKLRVSSLLAITLRLFSYATKVYRKTAQLEKRLYCFTTWFITHQVLTFIIATDEPFSSEVTESQTEYKCGPLHLTVTNEHHLLIEWIHEGVTHQIFDYVKISEILNDIVEYDQNRANNAQEPSPMEITSEE